MSRYRFAALLSALALGAASPALAVTEVKEVEVSIDLDAINNPQAATVWGNIASDLQMAIIGRVTDRVDEDGVKISVDINEVELANSFQSAMGIADSRLVGRVNISSETDNSKFSTYDLEVTFDQAYLPVGSDVTVLTIESPVYYATMIELFADRVVEKLD
ncbi:hypothetical protein [Frigidibacter mobilis]|uniref:Uncharacterized protein n=1 Tax=Frigidibacter mobilis TaxID=1335048 RepID=A0A161HBL0_9RHOB|nr:hypothetical protein [Frigidibacter mobilis]AMY67849.1 hypothetical protein AKL17_0589 [Frigidibacter mobilis]